ncbi:unnamed protein product [Kuraishia capsulata CBS 1993]|uniref:MOSC domain-containing protein n=1 Tax=Kuraishia capsulata CBS 1993 TaxID=1382522 RepID=W6MTC1_9ASCO|nr:uncharacterized protein KUCA_T00005656001 [Kuraishia capsulata CBS 1993]CDK29663.1 unnamed protein product [Kuraishia capsulata CBS 1993]
MFTIGIGSAKIDSLSGITVISGIGLGLSAVVCAPFVLSKLWDLESQFNTHKKSVWGPVARWIINAKYTIIGAVQTLFRLKRECGGSISKIMVYPIKSVGVGLETDEWEVDSHGLKFDREFMLSTWDDKKEAYIPVTQREYARLAAVRITFRKTSSESEPLDGVFSFVYPLKDDDVSGEFQGKSFELPAVVTEEYAVENSSSKGLHPVDLFGVPLTSYDITRALPEDFNDQLGIPKETVLLYSSTGKLVKTGSPASRLMRDLDSRFRKSLFHDYFPVLIFSEEDVKDLVIKAKEYNIDVQINFKSFRPNILLSGSKAPHDTDNWHQFNIVSKINPREKHKWTVGSKCARCPMPNVDLTKAEMDKKYPITNTITKYRRIDPGHRFAVFFGIYGIQHDSGYTIRVGDSVEIVSRKYMPFVDFE